MKVVFADTFYFLGLLNSGDEAHPRCRRFATGFDGSFVTTDFIFLELADALATPAHRVQTARFILQVRSSANFRVIAASTELLLRGMELYRSRVDKAWSLTDCTSFVVMEQGDIIDAATGDQHFLQAGFHALLLT